MKYFFKNVSEKDIFVNSYVMVIDDKMPIIFYLEGKSRNNDEIPLLTIYIRQKSCTWVLVNGRYKTNAPFDDFVLLKSGDAKGDTVDDLRDYVDYSPLEGEYILYATFHNSLTRPDGGETWVGEIDSNVVEFTIK